MEWRQDIFKSLDKDYASIYCSKIEHFKNKSKAEEKVVETNGWLNVSLVGRGNNGIPGQITNHLFRKDVLIEVNGYNESLKFNEDFELILRIARVGSSLELIGLVLFSIFEKIHGARQIHMFPMLA